MIERLSATRVPETVCVLISSYRRPDALLSCLSGLAMQTVLPDSILVVIRPDDLATREALTHRPADKLSWRMVSAPGPGLVAARNASLAACTADILVFCDDDTVAAADWIERILGHFRRDPELGGLGGRDRVHDGTGFDDRRQDVIGRIRWYGRAIGNHHLGHGAPREVDFLKGANMSFRAEAVAGLYFDVRLRGQGMQAHEDFTYSLAVRRRGWKLLYDPAVTLDHFTGRRDHARTYVARPGMSDPLAYFDSSFNYGLALWSWLPLTGRIAYVFWSFLIGVRGYPGLIQCARLTFSEGLGSWRKFFIYQRANLALYLFLIAQALAPKPNNITNSGNPG